MSAAQEHLQTVKTAQGHNQELGAALEALKTGIEQAVGAVVAACNTANDLVATAAAAAEQVTEAANATMSTGEAHVQAAQMSGHGTLALATSAYGECSSAYMNASGVFNALQTMQAMLAEVKENAGAPFVNASNEAETLGGGIAMIAGLLENADGMIQQAIDA